MSWYMGLEIPLRLPMAEVNVTVCTWTWMGVGQASSVGGVGGRDHGVHPSHVPSGIPPPSHPPLPPARAGGPVARWGLRRCHNVWYTHTCMRSRKKAQKCHEPLMRNRKLGSAVRRQNRRIFLKLCRKFRAASMLAASDGKPAPSALSSRVNELEVMGGFFFSCEFVICQ